jgi:hypothetical protein
MQDLAGSTWKGSPLGQTSTTTTSSHRSHPEAVHRRHAPRHASLRTAAAAMDLTGATASGGMAVAHRRHQED